MNIAKVSILDSHTLIIQTEEGKNGLFDITPYLQYEIFTALKKLDEFKKVKNGRYYIEWDCGADLSADTIESYLVLTH
ncbi:MAG: DUF2442 domain-containing protein [Candidatus Margulisiibacteriota bacterium]|jgi:hypothetical protein